MGQKAGSKTIAPPPGVPRAQAAAKAPEAVARLILFLRERGLSNIEAAKLFECAPSYVAMLRHQTARPGLQLAARIERATGIPAALWADVVLARDADDAA